MVSVGIVGLPNVGKSTLFNALLKKRVALAANYPFATVEPNVGVVAVPDYRLEKLAELVARSTSEEPLRVTSEVLEEPPIVPAVVEFVDIAGLVKGSSVGLGLGNQFLSHIREVDAIVHVLRDFEDENIIRAGAVSPESDREVVETELALADLQVVEKLIIGQDKQVRTTRDALDQTKLEILNQIKSELENVVMPSTALATDGKEDGKVKSWFKTLPLLSIKPVLYVYNVGEEEYIQKVLDREHNGNELVISAKLEEELADLSEDERREYLKELGIEEAGLERLIKKAYDLLGLISFFTTTGKKEVRAWTIKKGTKAPQAAGVVHTDFEKKFIMAKVVEYGKLIEAGSYTQAKAKGWIRTEGKDYLVQDGDVVEFLVSS